MDEVIFIHSELLQVVERNTVALDTNLLDEVTEFTPRSLSQIGKETVLVLGSLLHGGVGGQLLFHLPAEDVLITKHVTDRVLVNWHALLVCVVHGETLMSVSVLHLEVCLFGDARQLLGESRVDDGVHHALGSFLSWSDVSLRVLDHVDQSTLLGRVESGKKIAELGEFLLFVLKGLKARLADKVSSSNQLFEIVAASVKVLDKSRVQVFFILKLGNLLLLVVGT